jgi:hypothetical protein
MTADATEIRSLTAAQLVERFAADARRIGNPQKPMAKGNLKPGTPEYEIAASDLKAVSSELRARNAVAEVLPLFHSESNPVRAFAQGHFGRFDRELARSAFYGVQYGLPTQEVVELRRRVRAVPPDRPTLADMAVDELVGRFVDATTRLYATRFLDCIGDEGDMDIRNRIIGEEGDILRELKVRGALDTLLPLLDHQNPVVRAETATACLALDTEKAIAILESVAKSWEYLEKSYAIDALKAWREGKPVIWGVV